MFKFGARLPGIVLMALGVSAIASPGSLRAAPLLAVDFQGPSWSGPTSPAGYTGIAEGADLTNGVAVGDYTVQATSEGSLFHWSTNGGVGPLAALYADHLAVNTGPGGYARDPNGTGGFNSGNPIDIVLSGFDPNTAYELTFYAYDNGHTHTMKFWDTGGTGNTPLGTVSYTAGSPPTTADQYSTTFQLTSDATGALAITVTATFQEGYLTRVNGFEVAALVPEPASIALLAAGGVSLMARRRA